ncbi:hypothetical protein GCM10009430_03550 [Aquimarina litoralis]|uniref:Uncharacterized protein n=1 Tax=Aquimarina litoralis TaxID=584605 RepID=A0ABP3TMM1_9FLAO
MQLTSVTKYYRQHYFSHIFNFNDHLEQTITPNKLLVKALTGITSILGIDGTFLTIKS